MPRLPKLFGRKQATETAEAPTGAQPSVETSAPDAPENVAPPLPAAPDEGVPAAADAIAPLAPIPDAPADEGAGPPPPPAADEAGPVEMPEAVAPLPDVPAEQDERAAEIEESDSRATALAAPHEPPADAGSLQAAPERESAAPEAEPETPTAAPTLDADRRGESKTLIGGKEADLVPVIPNTVVDISEETDLDEESMTVATVEALKGACELTVARVNSIRKMQDGTQIIAGLIALVSELDVRYARDWGIVRRNGLEEVLIEVRESVVEGDRFILESLENGRGGLTADVFLRDLRTIAQADRPRMVASYAMFLVFVLKCVLRQYLRPLENDQVRLRDLGRRLDYLIDGIRDTLLARINGIPRMG